MISSNEASTIHLPMVAQQTIWRIFGNGLAPLKQSTCRDLIEPIIQKQLGKTDEADRAIAEIRSWFDPEGGPNDLRQEVREPVAEIIIGGIRGSTCGNHRDRESRHSFLGYGLNRLGSCGAYHALFVVSRANRQVRRIRAGYSGKARQKRQHH